MKTKFWPLPGYGNLYEVNEDGVIRSTHRIYLDSLNRRRVRKPHIISTRIERAGYPSVKLTKPDKRYGTMCIHRLVALTFIPNPLNKPIVNHINGNKRDFRVENLEWTDRSANQCHAILKNLARIPSQSRTAVYNACTKEFYPTIKLAAIMVNIPYHKAKQIIAGNILNNTCLRKATLAL